MKKCISFVWDVMSQAKEVVMQNRRKLAGASALVLGGSSIAFCANELETLINKVGTFAFGVLELVGAVLLVLGIVAFVKTMTGDDDHGTDQNATSKAVKKVIGGALMVFGPIIVLKWINATPTTLGTKFFGGL